MLTDSRVKDEKNKQGPTKWDMGFYRVSKSNVPLNSKCKEKRRKPLAEQKEKLKPIKAQ